MGLKLLSLIILKHLTIDQTSAETEHRFFARFVLARSLVFPSRMIHEAIHHARSSQLVC